MMFEKKNTYLQTRVVLFTACNNALMYIAEFDDAVNDVASHDILLCGPGSGRAVHRIGLLDC